MLGHAPGDSAACLVLPDSKYFPDNVQNLLYSCHFCWDGTLFETAVSYAAIIMWAFYSQKNNKK